MIVRQFLHTQPAVAISYLIGCGGRQSGAVIDPVEPPPFYIGAAEEAGLRLQYVVDTHVHADHRSSARDLAEASGAEYVLHATADTAFAFTAVQDGDVLELGNVFARTMHVPGHTPEHIALVVTDRARSNEPWFVLTGHTLMVGDMGRTELASSAEEGAAALFDSGRKLAALPDYVEVLPGAFSGSVCGRGLSGKPTSTIGFERQFNRAFSLLDRDAFVALMLEHVPPRPPNAYAVRLTNLGFSSQAAELIHR